MRWFLAMSLLVGGIVAAGCTTQSYDSRDGRVPLSLQGEAQDAKYPQADPVCGVRVNPRSAYTEEFDGRTWWFEHRECMDKFHKDPLAYSLQPGTQFDDRYRTDDRFRREAEVR